MAIINRLPWWLSGKRICLPMQDMQVQSIGQEDPPEKEMATHSTWKSYSSNSKPGNPIDRGPWRATVHSIAKSWT